MCCQRMHGLDDVQSGKAVRCKGHYVAVIALAVCRMFISIADSAHLSTHQLLAALVSSASHALAGFVAYVTA